MAKRRNQKWKWYHLREILLHKADEQHPLSMAEIRDYLRDMDIETDRKSRVEAMSITLAVKNLSWRNVSFWRMRCRPPAL